LICWVALTIKTNLEEQIKILESHTDKNNVLLTVDGYMAGVAGGIIDFVQRIHCRKVTANKQVSVSGDFAQQPGEDSSPTTVHGQVKSICNKYSSRMHGAKPYAPKPFGRN
jgi:hypothetical protein